MVVKKFIVGFIVSVVIFSGFMFVSNNNIYYGHGMNNYNKLEVKKYDKS